MHIPDWDAAFLASFEPASVIAQARAAHADAIMLYFQSHVGLCYWPTRSGRMHAAFAGRDVMAELLDHARRSGLPICAYYSVNFNNYAYEQHPDWRIVPTRPAMIGGGLLEGPRYGICCLNHPDYRNFVREQTREILGQYAVDAIFFDMVWWMSICVCTVCRGRFRSETGREIPATIDWLDRGWCEFQAARERWLVEFAMELRDNSRRARDGISVYHNFAVALGNWTRGISFESAAAHDFLGGDFYGGADEQLVISRLMLNLSEHRPVEFMTTVAANLAEHERLKSLHLLRAQTLAATASGAAFLGIVAIDPDGGFNAAAFDRLGTVYREIEVYEPYLGGTPIEEIGVYFSGASKMSFVDNGLPLDRAPVEHALDYPHLHALQGACRVLQRAHLPFGIITRRQIRDLARYRVLILPNVLRMDAVEIEAVREYVHGGGRVYASRYTSLTATTGERHPDLMLADVFGCHHDGTEQGRNIYLSPATPECAAAIAPERALSHWLHAQDRTGAMRLSAAPTASVLMTLTLPYGHPSTGSVDGHDWASIHTFPPWQRTDLPMVVEHSFGRGKALYAAADIEAGGTDSHDALFLYLIRHLAGTDFACGATAHPAVWMSAFDQPEHARWIICFLNNSRELPPSSPAPFEFHLMRTDGRRFVRLTKLPGGERVDFRSTRPDAIVAAVARLDPFAMFAAEYA